MAGDPLRIGLNEQGNGTSDVIGYGQPSGWIDRLGAWIRDGADPAQPNGLALNGRRTDDREKE